MSFDDGFILGLSLGGSGGGSGDEDTPAYLSDPDYQLYLDLPEPAENQVVYLIRTYENNVTVNCTVRWNIFPGINYPNDKNNNTYRRHKRNRHLERA